MRCRRSAVAYLAEHLHVTADAFLVDRFYVAPLGRRPAAVATLTEQEQECFPPKWREIRHYLGLIHGTISYLVIRSQFLGGLPDAQEGLAEIGFVTTHPTYQGRGVIQQPPSHCSAQVQSLTG